MKVFGVCPITGIHMQTVYRDNQSCSTRNLPFTYNRSILVKMKQYVTCKDSNENSFYNCMAFDNIKLKLEITIRSLKIKGSKYIFYCFKVHNPLLLQKVLVEIEDILLIIFIYYTLDKSGTEIMKSRVRVYINYILQIQPLNQFSMRSVVRKKQDRQI